MCIKNDHVKALAHHSSRNENMFGAGASQTLTSSDQ